MVSAVSSIDQYQIDSTYLEIIRRLQSLGISPTGNLSVDKQRLQKAELEKQQNTLASNSEQNLSKLSGTGSDFASVLGNVSGVQVQSVSNVENTQAVQPPSFADGMYALSDSEVAAKSGSTGNVNYNSDIAEKMTGATQLAELNKLKLGLSAA